MGRIQGSRRTLRCRLQRSSGSNRSGPKVCITIEDRASGIAFAEFEMDMEHWGAFTAGFGVHADVEIRGVEHLGMVAKYEQREVFVPSCLQGDGAAVKKLLDGFRQREGETVDYGDARNSHRMVRTQDEPVRGAWYRVGYRWFEDPEEGEGEDDGQQ